LGNVLASTSLWTRLLVVVAATAVAVSVVACGEEKPGEVTPVITPTVAEPTVTATGVPSTEIRDVDFSEVAEVRERLESIGGQLVREDIQYADLTVDGEEEAIVPLFSGGTAGNIALWVYGYVDDRLEVLLSRPQAYKIFARVEDGTVVLVEPVYGPNDPNCCPSQLTNTYYEWDGSELALVREETIDNPNVTP
jgi:hypothetical protein